MNEAQRAEIERIIAAYSAGSPAMAVLYAVLIGIKAPGLTSLALS
ncbi:hypothetical protein [Glycomyces niveus]|nr:hypothetical protein [Glycomyces sp. NEAU-S30]